VDDSCLSPRDTSLLNGMVFDIVPADKDSLHPYKVVIVSSPVPSTYETTSVTESWVNTWNTEVLDERVIPICHYNSGTLVNFYLHPWTKTLRMSTASSVDARSINHPLAILEDGKIFFDEVEL
jgi:hypothetical protein